MEAFVRMPVAAFIARERAAFYAGLDYQRWTDRLGARIVVANHGAVRVFLSDEEAFQNYQRERQGVVIMSQADIQGWILIGGQLASMGLALGEKFKSMIKSFRSDATDDDVDAIIRGVIADAERRKLLAQGQTGS